MVLSREVGQSVIIKAPEGSCLVTVVQFDHRASSALILVNQAKLAHPGDLSTQAINLRRFKSFRVGASVHVTLIEVREDKVRLGFVVPRDVPVHRLELVLQEDILEEVEPPFRLPGTEDDQGDDGGAPAPVPRPPSPKPPALRVQLDAPKTDDD